LNFPYKVIHVESAEADDTIAVLTKEFYAQEKILILSSDKDFQQLQKYRGVKQWSPLTKKYIVCDNPVFFLNEHIIKGDVSDGIPNFLSPDNSFVMSIRQSPVSSKKLSSWILQQPEHFCNDLQLRNYKRNQLLIDMEYIPDDIADKILEQYHSQQKDRSKLFNYFIEHKLRNLMDALGEF
jgi:5'-3' exonuclease